MVASIRSIMCYSVHGCAHQTNRLPEEADSLTSGNIVLHAHSIVRWVPAKVKFTYLRSGEDVLL